MIFPFYCKTCDAITGHEIRLFKSPCKKCGTYIKTPIVRWAVGVIGVVGLTAFLVWIIITSIRTIFAI
jgi:hypothetical protein